jgi:hypothetical protein
VRFIFRNVLNYGYFRTGSNQYIGAIASEKTTEVGKSKGRIQHVRNCKSENPAAEKLMFFIV